MKATTLHMLRTCTLEELKAVAKSAKQDHLSAKAQAIEAMTDFLKRSTLPAEERPYGELISYQQVYTTSVSGHMISKQDMYVLVASKGEVMIRAFHTTVTESQFTNEPFEPTPDELERFLNDAIMKAMRDSGIIDAA
jgi:hypothetical protein